MRYGYHHSRVGKEGLSNDRGRSLSCDAGGGPAKARSGRCPVGPRGCWTTGNAKRGPGNYERPRSPVHLEGCRLATRLGWVEESAEAGGILGLREPRSASAGVETLDWSQTDNPGLPLRSNRVLD